MRFRSLSSLLGLVLAGFLGFSGCTSESGPTNRSTSIDSDGERAIATPRAAVGPGQGSSPLSAEYELLSVLRDGWKLTAQVRGPAGDRELTYTLRSDEERCSYTGEVRSQGDLVWRQSVEASLDGSRAWVEESDGVDLLRIEILAGEREDYTFVAGDGGVRYYSAAVGSEDRRGWMEFWPATGLDWNPDAALCNGFAKGRILQEEVRQMLAPAEGGEEPQSRNEILEQLCKLIRICATLKCRLGGDGNQICLECRVGAEICDLLQMF